MNLPIKLVDLVTLLFLSLLVVIIIFIILQRNIKRFKLRNVKDPHYLTCKSIPKELKDAIRKKHEKNLVYTEPPYLITSSYRENPNEKTKLFLIRMKVYDISKHLVLPKKEFALNEYGLKRSPSIKFEDFISNIIELKNSKMPNDLLRDFNMLYKWAMIDPLVFTVDNLKKVYKLINDIIDHLASIHKSSDRLLQFKLDLNEFGDYDFKKLYEKSSKTNINNFNYNLMNSTSDLININNSNSNNLNLNSEINSIKSKQVKFDEIKNQNIKINNNEMENQTSKLKQTTKNIFHRRQSKEKISNNDDVRSSKETDIDKEKLLNDSIDTSFESTKSNFKTRKSKTTTASSSSSNLNEHESDDNRWSQTNDSMKTFDSENEQIPLVKNKKSTHNKKKSNHSDITIVPTVVSATPTGFVTSKLNTKNKSHSNLVASLTPNNSIQLTTLNNNNNKDSCAAENEAFNKTFDNNF